MCTGTSSLRGLLIKLGLGLNAMAAALGCIPVVGYIRAPALGRSAQALIRLAPPGRRPHSRNRLPTSKHPVPAARCLGVRQQVSNNRLAGGPERRDPSSK